MRIPCHRPRAEREVTGRETGLINLDLASEYGRLTASSAQGWTRRPRKIISRRRGGAARPCAAGLIPARLYRRLPHPPAKPRLYRERPRPRCQVSGSGERPVPARGALPAVLCRGCPPNVFAGQSRGCSRGQAASPGRASRSAWRAAGTGPPGKEERAGGRPRHTIRVENVNATGSSAAYPEKTTDYPTGFAVMPRIVRPR
jgi:hypothetical protein